MEFKLEIVAFLLRVFTGMLFFFQGYDKIFNVKIKGVINTFVKEAQQHPIRRYLLTAIAVYASFVEFLGGMFLIAGLYTDYNLLVLGIDLILVTLAFSLIKPVWDLQHIFPRLILVVALLLMPGEWNKISLDLLLGKN